MFLRRRPNINATLGQRLWDCILLGRFFRAPHLAQTKSPYVGLIPAHRLPPWHSIKQT